MQSIQSTESIESIESIEQLTLHDLPEDILISTISNYLGTYTPILVAVDKRFRDLIFCTSSLKIIHCQNFSQSKNWVSIFHSYPNLIKWYFSEPKIHHLFKDKRAPSVLAHIIHDEEFQIIINSCGFSSLHNDIVVEAITNNLDHKLLSFNITKQTTNLCHYATGTKKITSFEQFRKTAKFIWTLDRYYHSLIHRLLKTNDEETRSIRAQQFTQLISQSDSSVQLFFNSRSTFAIVKSINDLITPISPTSLPPVSRTDEFTIFTLQILEFICYFAPHLKKSLIQQRSFLSFTKSHKDSYSFIRLISCSEFLNDIEIVQFVKISAPYFFKSNVTRPYMWPLLFKHCSNVNVLKIFFEECQPIALDEKIIHHINNYDSFVFAKENRFQINKKSFTTFDLKVLKQFKGSQRSKGSKSSENDDNFGSFDKHNFNHFYSTNERSLSRIVLNCLEQNHLGPHFCRLMFNKSSVDVIVNYITNIDDFRQMNDFLNQLITLSNKNFLFFHKLMIRSSINHESLKLIFLLSIWKAPDENDYHFALEKSKWASAKFIQTLLPFDQ